MAVLAPSSPRPPTSGTNERGTTPATPASKTRSPRMSIRSRGAYAAPVGHAFERPFQVAYDDVHRQHELKFLRAMFNSADKDGSGLVDYEEFCACMHHPKTFHIMNRRFGLQRHETPRVFRAIDNDCSGTINIDEWLSTCTFLMDVVKEGEVIENWHVRELKELQRRAEKAAGPSRRSPVMPTLLPQGGASNEATSVRKADRKRSAATAAAKAMLTPRTSSGGASTTAAMRYAAVPPPEGAVATPRFGTRTQLSGSQTAR